MHMSQSRRTPRPNLRPLLLAGVVCLAASLSAQPARRQLDNQRSVRRLAAESEQRQQEARAKAAAAGWLVRGEGEGGALSELMLLGPTGMPLYNEALTTNASIGVNAPALHGDTPSIVGASVTVGVWDEGSVRDTHVEFDGGARCVNGEVLALSNHSTAVAGVIIAAGSNAGVIGTAKGASAECYDWNNNTSEMTSRAPLSPADTGAIPVSNHSYGFVHGWQNGSYSGTTGPHWFGENWKPDGSGNREDPKFGLYSSFSAELDQFSADNPWHLVFWAAGNDRDDVYPYVRDGSAKFFYYDEDIDDWNEDFWVAPTAPFDDGGAEAGYDSMITRSCGKNVVAVGSLTDPVTLGVRDPFAATPSNFSGWGPADDGRVKPDVVANGQSLLVTIAGSDSVSYGGGTASGTSFSSPNAAGVAALIVDAAQTHIPGWMPRASTVKCLLIHGATDLGNAGPDYIYGWGLPDAVASVEPIVRQAAPATASAWCATEGLLDTNTPLSGDEYEVAWDGVADLKVTLCWTDPPGTSPGFVLDDRTPVLVNDLDLRVTGPGGTQLPFVLDPTNPADLATTGDNVVDTVEQILLASGGAAGDYTVTVNMKNAIPAEGQWYSLAISGHQPAVAGPAPVTVDSATPTVVSLDSVSDVVLAGSGFHPGSTVLLRRTGESDVELTGEYSSPASVHGMLDASGLALGLWDVVVTRPDNESATLANGIAIVDSSSVNDWRDLE